MFNNYLTQGNSKKAQAINNVLNGRNECGKYGIAFEIACKAQNNNICAGHDKSDKVMYVISANGQKIKKTVEIKTNGGRIDNIENSDYVIYAMDICNSTTKGVRRETKPIIMKSTSFMAILVECGAIKRVNKQGMFDGYAIQVSNKAFYETMRDYPIKYENGKVYGENEII